MLRHLIGLPKPSSWNHPVISKTSCSRLFSSSIPNPYLTLGTTLKNILPDGSEIRDILLFDPAKEEMLTVSDKTFPQELVESRQIGSTRGWGIFSNDHDRSLCISDLYNPLASKSNPTMVPLPSLAAVHSNQANVVWNVAMSSSPGDEDCVVAIKFLGRQLSLCRPHSDIRWTNVGEILVEKLENLENSNLTYSKRERRFYLPGPGGNSLYSWDLHLKKNKSLKLHELLFRDLPELDDSEWKLLGWCCRTEHLVESVSSGERFLVKWYMYAQRFFSPSHEGTNYTTRRFMVFREKTMTEGRYMYYTEDIGDVCIFLSMSEAFCVQASSCPGLKPNSIYFIGHGFGIYNLSDTTIHHFQAPEGAPTSFKDPYWLPPSCI
ncbi:unnamed protein product [Thlaspi arvense]|uniref:KIB1-4 beta-propeller domain-containing protein n=1 Tax=Thlaspi arvense TaxID=13288 RepID=A0AAU9R644_THLAR|nr:unnamed protein product [Thlaspi arvense]